jgi:hypothetical protein
MFPSQPTSLPLPSILLAQVTQPGATTTLTPVPCSLAWHTWRWLRVLQRLP